VHWVGWGNYACGGHWLDDGARAVGDSQGGGLSDGVGDAVVGQGGGIWAVGGVGGDNIGDIVNNHAAGVVGWVDRVGGRGSGYESGNSGDGGELHLDGLLILLLKK